MKRNITAKTFTPSYDTLEDRIRVVVNYQDMNNRVDFMITRSFILNLIPTAEEFIDKHYGTLRAPTLQTQGENASLSQTDTANLELLRTGEELLTEVNFSFVAETKQTLLTFTSRSAVAQADLDATTLLQVFQVIKSAIPNFSWGISQHF